MKIGFDAEQAGHLCALDDLDRVEDGDEREVAGERYVSAYLLRRPVTVNCKVRTSCPPDRLEARSDRDTRVKQLCFLQAVVGKIEILAGDVEAYKREALLGGL